MQSERDKIILSVCELIFLDFNVCEYRVRQEVLKIDKFNSFSTRDTEREFVPPAFQRERKLGNWSELLYLC